MQNVKDTEEVLLIRYCSNIIHTSDYSNVSCSWRKCWCVLFWGQEEKAGCCKAPDSLWHNSCFMLLFWSVDEVSLENSFVSTSSVCGL